MIRKILKYFGLLLVAGILFITILLFTSNGKKPSFNPGEEFKYERLDQIGNNNFRRDREYIELKDGNKIAITYLLPEEIDEEGYPIILYASPYTSTIFIPEMKWYERAFSKWSTGNWGPIYDRIAPDMAKTYTSLGYAVVLMDLRGTGSSTGISTPNDPKYIQDFTEVFDWLQAQPWSNGKIGMTGQSYLGWAQFAAGASQHPALKCIAPAMISTDFYTDNVSPGGIKSTNWIEDYSKVFEDIHNSIWNPEGIVPTFPTVPLDDMDNDGEITDEIPIIEKGKYFADSMVDVTYLDGKERPNNPYLNFLRDRQRSQTVSKLVENSRFIDDSTIFDNRVITYSDVGPINLSAKIKESKIPVLLIGGFFDYFEGIPQLYSSLKNSNAAFLFAGPRFHLPVDIPEPYKELLGYKHSYNDAQIIHTLRFFDHYLKGIDNGFDKEEPVKIYTSFKGWQSYSTWPIKESKYNTFYLQPGKLSSTNTQLADTLIYRVDYTHSGRYGKNKLSPNNAMLFMNNILERSEQDKKCIIFETEELASPMTMTGYPIVNLRLSSNQPNADVYVYLEDVAPDGMAYYIAEAQLRAGWHKLFDNDMIVDYAFDVEPELPWHSYKSTDYDPTPFNDGAFQTLRFNLKPHSWTFRKGHKLRISIAGADKDVFEFNPECCPENKFEHCKETDFYIVTGGENGSFIELPIMRENF